MKPFRFKAWSEALSIAILNDYPLSVIKWIIASGANVNEFFMYESPLMKAVARPDVLKLLLNKGAKIDAQTPYGKTALFYAIQYGPLESVKILVKKRANVNHSPNSLDEFKETSKNDFFLLENVANFTPLIYSLGEENDEKMLFLLKHDAKLGDVKRKKIKKWILSNSKISEEKLDERLASFQFYQGGM